MIDRSPAHSSYDELPEAAGCGVEAEAVTVPSVPPGLNPRVEALRYALNVPRFYLQCHEDLKAEHILYYWEDKDGPKTRENLVLCDPLAAYEAPELPAASLCHRRPV